MGYGAVCAALIPFGYPVFIFCFLYNKSKGKNLYSMKTYTRIGHLYKW